MRRLFLTVAVLVGLLTACEDRGECVEGHHQPLLINKVTTLVWICDTYEADLR